MRADVARGVVDADGVLLVVDPGRPLGQRLELVEHGRQDLVGHRDAAAGRLGDLGGLGGHGRHAVAHVTDLVVEAHLVPRVRVGPALAA
jgi:hypothetical protein